MHFYSLGFSYLGKYRGTSSNYFRTSSIDTYATEMQAGERAKCVFIIRFVIQPFDQRPDEISITVLLLLDFNHTGSGSAIPKLN
jgi:hypothetical protein